MRDNGRVSNTLIRFGEHAPQGSRVLAPRRRPEWVQRQSNRLLAIVTIRGSFVLRTVQTLQLLQTQHPFQTL
ncbi:hypothetical protein LMG22037_04584 [Paraburkholderia phenoliruptrix]|uniref:Uncharacterized protein n=1 Tax=Paraburkholderia phenoliruptrix TaxID=252970 RepID=A0A6J5BUT9_9BURK|nr:hypothetical protein LMG22037_04584 [Paraburkholderia phenoliruptrix]